MVQRFVYGTYNTAEEAHNVINQLIARGVDPSAISLTANRSVLDKIDTNIDVIDAAELENGEDNRSWFDKLFGFNDETLQSEGIDYAAYQDAFMNNQILVIVDSIYEGESYRITDRDGVYNDVVPTNDLYDADERNLKDVDQETIRLHEEQVHARAVEREAGEVEITKNVVEDTKTVEVPVKREEVHITRTVPTDGAVDDLHAFQEETIVVPVSEEEVIIDKDVVVTDEFNIDRVEKTDYETVTETTRREELDVKGDENLNVVDEDNTFKKDELNREVSDEDNLF